MKFLYLLLALSSTLFGFEKPNIILINADDLGYGDLSCYGATKIKTPNIDKLAKEGRRFTDAHSPSAVCSPSRYGLITGKYPFRINLWGPLGGDQKLVVPTEDKNIASILKEAGYTTAIIGKWHLGLGDGSVNYNKPIKPSPNDLGFDYSYIIPAANSVPPFLYVENGITQGLDPDDPITRGKGKVYTKKLPEKGAGNYTGGKKAHELYDDFQIGNHFTKLSKEWMKKNKDKPFFLYLATSHIHHPFTPDPRFNGTSECGAYGDFTHELDWMVGEVAKVTEEIQKETNRKTLIIFTSDNGGMVNGTGQKAWKMGHKLNGPLAGFKFGVWEGGHRVPFIVNWPGVVPAGTESSNLISHIDLLATFAEIAGKDKPEGIDGLGQLNEFLGKAETPVREELAVLCNSSQHISIRTKKWLYIPSRDTGGFVGKWGSHAAGGVKVIPFTGQKNSDVVDGKYKDDAPAAQLYNLEEDLGQEVNVILKYPELAKQMQAKVDQFLSEIPKTPWLGWSADKSRMKKK